MGDGRRVNVPWYWQQQDLLDLDKGRKHANDQARSDQHNEHPEVELDGRPVVFVDALNDAALIHERAARYCGRHCDGLSG